MMILPFFSMARTGQDRSQRWQDVPHSSPAARGALARARVAALQTDDTAARLEVSAAVLRATRSALAAKAALHALALE